MNQTEFYNNLNIEFNESIDDIMDVEFLYILIDEIKIR